MILKILKAYSPFNKKNGPQQSMRLIIYAHKFCYIDYVEKNFQ